jgi:hypothetical protein
LLTGPPAAFVTVRLLPLSSVSSPIGCIARLRKERARPCPFFAGDGTAGRSRHRQECLDRQCDAEKVQREMTNSAVQCPHRDGRLAPEGCRYRRAAHGPCRRGSVRRGSTNSRRRADHDARGVEGGDRQRLRREANCIDQPRRPRICRISRTPGPGKTTRGRACGGRPGQDGRTENRRMALGRARRTVNK